MLGMLAFQKINTSRKCFIIVSITFHTILLQSKRQRSSNARTQVCVSELHQMTHQTKVHRRASELLRDEPLITTFKRGCMGACGCSHSSRVKDITLERQYHCSAKLTTG